MALINDMLTRVAVEDMLEKDASLSEAKRAGLRAILDDLDVLYDVDSIELAVWREIERERKKGEPSE